MTVNLANSFCSETIELDEFKVVISGVVNDEVVGPTATPTAKTMQHKFSQGDDKKNIFSGCAILLANIQLILRLLHSKTTLQLTGQVFVHIYTNAKCNSSINHFPRFSFSCGLTLSTHE